MAHGFTDPDAPTARMSKTKVLFSRNVPVIEQRELSRMMGYTKTGDIGKYLGMPLVQGRVTRRTYDDLLAKVDKRIAGWKMEKLSFAGRITLAKYVLTSIPAFAMQTAKILVMLRDEIERKIRSFLWGGSGEKRKIHPVAWSKICQPTDKVGLGLRSMRLQNEVYLMKLAWGQKNRKGLWDASDVKVKARGNLSHQWRGILFCVGSSKISYVKKNRGWAAHKFLVRLLG